MSGISRGGSRFPWPAWPVVLACLLPLAFSASGVERLANTAPAMPPRTVQLEEIWRVGGEDDDLMFGLMVAALADDDGNVYLMDQQLCQVVVISPAGEHLRTIGREGDGPGELRTPQGMVFLPDGTLGLAEQFPGRFVKLTLDGEPAGVMEVGNEASQGGFTALAGCRHWGGSLVINAQFSAPIENGQSRNAYLARLGPEGEELVRFCDNTVNLDFQEAHFVEREMLPSFMGAYTVGPQGKVYAATARNEYLISVYLPDGALERIIEREFANREREPRECERWNALFEVQARNLPFDITWEVEKYYQTVAGLHVTADGTVWVQHSRSDQDQPSGVMLSYDLFDAGGRYLREARIACDGNPAYDGLLFLRDGRVLLVKGLVLAQLTATGSQGAVFDEDEGTGPMEIICCRMVD